MFNNDNYGDFIQAKVWIDWYREQNIKTWFICNENLKNKLKQRFFLKRISYLSPEQFNNIKISHKSIFHLYGGGYLNEKWGDPYISILYKAQELGMKIISTGIQMDSYGAQKISRINIDYVSVRDINTYSMLKTNSLICDDSFGYFSTRMAFFKTIQAIPKILKRKKIVLQLSLNPYVYEKVQEIKIRDFYQRIIEYFASQTTPLYLISSFPQDVGGIIESTQLISHLSLSADIKNKISYGTTEELDKNMLSEPKAIFATSFHTYLLSIFKYTCPTYLIVFSDYYRQKANALLAYGLIDNNHIIDSLDMVKHLNINGNIDRSISLRKNVNRFSKVKKTIQDTFLI